MHFKKMSPSKIKSINICDCGAVTVGLENGEYSMTSETFEKVFGFTIYTGIYSSCNHCVNHWGIDLCACGSGEAYDTCEEGFNECGKPLQVLGLRDRP
jgi:hypothetical protein